MDTRLNEVGRLIEDGEWGELWQPMGDVALLNHGSYGRTFRHVRELQGDIERTIDADPARFYRRDHRQRITDAAADIARWLGIESRSAAAFTHNASMATLTTIGAFLRPGGSVLTTSLGYGAVAIGTRHLAGTMGAQHIDVNVNTLDDAIVADTRILEKVTATKPDVVVIDQITSSTALRLPLERLIPDIRSASPDSRIIVDAAHAAGMEQLPVVAGADVWIANLHKWACAAPGTAIIVANRDTDIGPLLRSWTGDDRFPESHLWLGTDAKASYLTAPLATRIMTDLCTAGLDTHIRTTLADASRHLADAWGVPADARPEPMRAPWMSLIEIPGNRTFEQPDLTRVILAVRDALKADVNITGYGGTTYLRLSAHGYNTGEQYDRLVDLPDVITRLG